MKCNIPIGAAQFPTAKCGQAGDSHVQSTFLDILTGIDPAFPKYTWDRLLPQTELMLNLLRQTMLNPRIYAWEYFNGSFDFAATPLGILGSKVVIYNTVITSNF